MEVKLTSYEKVILYLLRHHHMREKFSVPFDVTQEGIATALGIRRSHIPRMMQKLKARNQVEERVAHVEGFERRRKVYFLTTEGYRLAQKLKLQVGELRPEPSPVRYVHEYLRVPPEPFYGRNEELEILYKSIRTKKHKMIIISGLVGIGKTAFVAKLIEKLKSERNVLWTTLSEGFRLQDFVAQLHRFSSKLGLAQKQIQQNLSPAVAARLVLEEIKKSNSIFVVDSFQTAEPEIQQFFRLLLPQLQDTDATFILLSRVIPELDGPEYSKHFFHIQLEGLNEKESINWLKSKGIRSAVATEIWRVTKGHPLCLEIIESEKDWLKKREQIAKIVYDAIIKPLSDDEKKVLERLAVLRTLPSSLKIDEPKLDALLQKNILHRTAAGAIIFPALIKDTVYSLIEPVQRKKLHSDAARFYVAKITPWKELLSSNLLESARKLAPDADEFCSNVLDAIYHLFRCEEFASAVNIISSYGKLLTAEGWIKQQLEVLSELDDTAVDRALYRVDDAELVSLAKMAAEGIKLRNLDTRDWCSVLIAKGELTALTGRIEEAEQLFSKARALANRFGYSDKGEFVNLRLGFLNLLNADWDAAKRYFESLDFSSQPDNIRNQIRLGKGIACCMLGLQHRGLEYLIDGTDSTMGLEMLYARIALSAGYLEHGEFVSAIEHASNVLALSEHIRFRFVSALAQLVMGRAYLGLAMAKEAKDCLTKSLEKFRFAGCATFVAHVLSALAEAHIHNGELDDAERFATEALKICIQLNDTFGTALCNRVLGMVHRFRRRYSDAEKCFATATAIFKKLQMPKYTAELFCHWALLYNEMEDVERAALILDHAAALYDVLGLKHLFFITLYYNEKIIAALKFQL